MCTLCVSLYLAIYNVILINGVVIEVKLVLLLVVRDRVWSLLLDRGIFMLVLRVGWLRKGV